MILAATVPSIANPPIDYHAIAPELVLAGTIFAVLALDLFLPQGRKHLSMWLGLVGAAGALVATFTLIGSTRSTFGGSYVLTLSDQNLPGATGGQTLTINVTGEVVPEPASLGLIGAAAMLGLGRRRRRSVATA